MDIAMENRTTDAKARISLPKAFANATVIIEYESGVRGVLDTRWHSQVDRDEFCIRGTDGEIELTPLNGPELVFPGGVEHLPAHANLHYPCIEDFVSAVLNDREPRATGVTSLPTEWVMETAQRRVRRIARKRRPALPF